MVYSASFRPAACQRSCLRRSPPARIFRHPLLRHRPSFMHHRTPVDAGPPPVGHLRRLEKGVGAGIQNFLNSGRKHRFDNLSPLFPLRRRAAILLISLPRLLLYECGRRGINVVRGVAADRRLARDLERLEDAVLVIYLEGNAFALGWSAGGGLFFFAISSSARYLCAWSSGCPTKVLEPQLPEPS